MKIVARIHIFLSEQKIQLCEIVVNTDQLTQSSYVLL